MKMKILAALIAVTSCLSTLAQTFDTNGDFVQTFAGSGFAGHVDGVGQLTMFSSPNAIVADSGGNLFIWESANKLIRRIEMNGMVSTFAGGGNQVTGSGTNAFFNVNGIFFGMAIDRNNTIWGTGGDAKIHKITGGANVSEISLPLSWPWGICLDSANNLFLSDYTGNKIYKQSTNGTLTVFAGSGNAGYADGNGIFTAFHYPAALATDAADNIYVWDLGNGLIRKIDQNQNVTTFAGQYQVSGFQSNSNLDAVGTNANFSGSGISAMCFDNSGNLILACGNCVRKITATTNVVTVAGSFTQTGYTNGAGSLARFNGADGVCISGGTVYVADLNNQRIRSITNNPQPQVISSATLGLATFAGVTITGIVGKTYQIQSSPDLNTWATLATVLLNSSPYLWIDQNPVAGNKFYQAVLLP